MTNKYLQVAFVLAVLGGSSIAVTNSAKGAVQQTAPDNTKTNQRDRSQDATTADQQKNNGSDLEMTQKIRRLIEQDKSLSTYAHNVKVVTQDGRVTLKGPVNTAEEKRSIEEKAVSVAGAEHVSNQIDIVRNQNQ